MNVSNTIFFTLFFIFFDSSRKRDWFLYHDKKIEKMLLCFRPGLNWGPCAC